jgi:hypothetical protein
MSRTINMTAEKDNNIVWLIKITRGADSWKFATKDITLSTNLWDGKALAINDNRFSMNEIGKRINIPSGGTLGEISTITFSFIRYGANTFINDFFNEFYPATSGLILVAMDVEVGMVWDSSTSEADITWIYKYNVEEYEYSDNLISLICSEFSDFEYFNLPYYRVQTEFDNGISYYPEASEEAIGKNLPIVYGSTAVSSRPFDKGFTPVVRVTKDKFIIATHECHNAFSPAVENRLFEEIAEY